MKTTNSLMVLLLIIFMFNYSTAYTEVPQVINYQGSLTDNSGVPVVDGMHSVTFTIYDTPVGGSSLWSSGAQNVTTVNGLFEYMLGSNVPLPASLFSDTTLYLGITIGVDPELSPRTKLVTVPFAYHSLTSDTAEVATTSPGVTLNIDDGDVIVTGFLNVINVDSINCPSDGYVMVSTTTGMNCNHTNGDEDAFFILITDSTTSITSDQDGHAWVLPSNMPSGLYGNPIHTHKVFPVSAGWNKYQVLGFQNAGGGTDNFSSQDAITSLLFIPQSLGTIDEGTKSAEKKFESVQMR